MPDIVGRHYQANEERAMALFNDIDARCDGNDPVDIVGATHSVLCHAIALISNGSLEAALLNVDALAQDMKSLLRQRLGN